MTLRLLTLLLFAAANAVAENAVVGTGSPASCTTAVYNAAIALVINDNQGGALSFNCGPNPHVIAVPSTALANFVVIDGGGKITRDGQDLNRIFTVSQDGPEGRTDVTLSNLTLRRGRAINDFGGAILVNTNTALALTNVIIEDSRADLTGGAIAAYPGAGIRIEASRLTRNRARDGGAVATSSNITINQSVFFNNSAEVDQGGALQVWFSQMLVTNSRFEFNDGLNGGAILQRGGTATFRNVEFSENQSRDRGGAYHLYEGGMATMDNSRFTLNTAATDGGAVYVAGIASAEEGVSVSNRYRANNTRFERNRALRAGGALFNYGRPEGARGAQAGDVELRLVTILNNEANLGGGIFNRGFFRGIDLTLSANTAVDGAGAYLAVGPNPVASPAETEFTLTRGRLLGNIASGFGGGLLIASAIPVSNGMHFEGNRAQNGGAVAIVGSVVTQVTNASFVRNVAVASGGGIYVGPSFATLIRSVSFNRNQVTSAGGRGGDLHVAGQDAADTGARTTVFLQRATLIDSAANVGSSVYASDRATLRIKDAVLWPLVGGGCGSSPLAIIESEGGNVGTAFGCAFNQSTDISVQTFNQIGLGHFLPYSNGTWAFTPSAQSIALDRTFCDPDVDQRAAPSPVDGNADGVATCDAGAIERQLIESSDVIFANGFETL